MSTKTENKEPQTNHQQKKIMRACLVLALSVSLTGCGNERRTGTRSGARNSSLSQSNKSSVTSTSGSGCGGRSTPGSSRWKKSAQNLISVTTTNRETGLEDPKLEKSLADNEILDPKKEQKPMVHLEDRDPKSDNSHSQGGGAPLKQLEKVSVTPTHVKPLMGDTKKPDSKKPNLAKLGSTARWEAILEQIRRSDENPQLVKDSNLGGSNSLLPTGQLSVANDCGGKRGMNNLNNTCYFNSGLQILAHAKSFVEAVRGVDDKNKALQTTQAFKQFIESQCEHSKTAIDPAEFFARFTQLDPAYFQLGKPRDSLEAVNRGLGALDGELSDQRSNPAELFKFQVRTTKNMVAPEEHRVEDHTYMSLHLKVRASDKNGVNVKEMVQRKFSEVNPIWEEFDGEHAPPPLYLGDDRQTLVSTPRLLLIHIDRIYNYEKLQYPVNFEQQLQMQAEEKASVTYTLIGVSHHSGTHNGGHYYSDVYHPEDKKWYRADDSSFEELDNPFPAQHSVTAHFLLYELLQ